MRLAREPRVVALEGCDARRLDATLIPEPVGAIVADVSFISLTKALPAPLALVAAEAWLIAFRAVQGVGSGFMMPATLSIITNTF